MQMGCFLTKFWVEYNNSSWIIDADTSCKSFWSNPEQWLNLASRWFKMKSISKEMIKHPSLEEMHLEILENVNTIRASKNPTKPPRHQYRNLCLRNQPSAINFCCSTTVPATSNTVGHVLPSQSRQTPHAITLWCIKWV